MCNLEARTQDADPGQRNSREDNRHRPVLKNAVLAKGRGSSLLYVAALLLAISSNLDDLGAGVALGLASFRVTPGQAAVIAGVSGLTLWSGMQMGELVAGLLPPGSTSLASLAIFLGIGLFFLLGARVHSARYQGDVPRYRLSGWGVVGLALALGIDSLALGIPAGLAAYPEFITPLLAVATSLAFVLGGNRLAHRLVQSQLASRTRLISGATFLLLAAAEAPEALTFFGTIGS